MMIGPYLGDGLRIELSSDLVSRPYVEMTAAVMAAFGVGAVEVGERTVVVPAGRYVGRTYEVEPDASSASYPLAIAALVGGSITVERLGTATLQGDAVFADLLARMGCTVVRDRRGVSVARASGSPLVGIDVDLADASDLVPTLAAVAAAATTPSRITGVGFIRGKESDRLGDLASELRVLGADVDVEQDGLVVRPAALHGGRIHTHHDHRVAMALAVLGCVVPGVEIVDPGVVSKSWPDFWDRLDQLAAQPASGA
jgi:3-phosphoshikimate 1-carboxyvinyltransferase